MKVQTDDSDIVANRIYSKITRGIAWEKAMDIFEKFGIVKIALTAK
jgi:hypothetical protein